MAKYTKITIWRGSSNALMVSIGMFKTLPGRRTPVPVHPPWEHWYTMQPDVDEEALFNALKAALQALDQYWGAAARARAPAPLEGPRGGVTQ